MNERGFLTVSLLIFMPLFMSILAVIAGAFLLMKGDSSTRHECRMRLLSVQTEVASDLKKLLAMNQQAAILRRRRLLAERAALAAVEPASKTAAQAALLAVIVQQLAFGVQQQALIIHGKWLSTSGPESARAKIISTAQQTRPEPSANSLPVNTHTMVGAFHLIATPPGSPTPDYKPAPGFSRTQKMKVRWSLPVNRFLPAWFNQILDLDGIRTSAECSATLEKENRKWHPKISKDKSLSSFW